MGQTASSPARAAASPPSSLPSQSSSSPSPTSPDAPQQPVSDVDDRRSTRWRRSFLGFPETQQQRRSQGRHRYAQNEDRAGDGEDECDRVTSESEGGEGRQEQQHAYLDGTTDRAATHVHDNNDDQRQQQQQQQQQQHIATPAATARPRRPRSMSINRLSQLLSSHQDRSRHGLHDSPPLRANHDVDTTSASVSAPASAPDLTSTLRRPSRLQRARTSLSASISNLSTMSFRRTPPSTPSSRLEASTPARPAVSPRSTTTTTTNDAVFSLPDVAMAEPLHLDFDHDDDHDDNDNDRDHRRSIPTTVGASRPATPRSPSRRSSLRLPTALSDRFSGFRSDRAQRPLHRRRRSPLDPGATHGSRAGSRTARDGSTAAGAGAGSGAAIEDNTALLSRLLSVAAAATAATLLEGNQQAIADAHSVAGDGDDGTFSSFLQSLESGRLAAALRGAGQTTSDEHGNPTQTHAPLNFFRMFRFGSPPAAAGATRTSDSTTSASSPNNTSGNPASSSTSNNAPTNADGRMVPIIIVGIRSVNPAGASNADDNGMPPFLNALSALPTTPFGDGPVDHDSIDNILRSPQNGTHFTHRRRASMGGVNSIASGYDAQRHHRSPERTLRRPVSVAGETAPASRHQPVTQASPALSRVASTDSSSRPASVRSAARRESIIRTTTTTTLDTTSEDAPLRPRAPRQRRLSESDYRGTFSSRRNGFVEPDNPTPPSENTRSWIIYVLGGSYPENHPILTTPSLFTDSPTYEDMMLLSALLGPAKPPVASEQDVATAGGVFKIESVDRGHHGVTLLAVDAARNETVEIGLEQRCLVCLCDFEANEEARQLVKCRHLFHKECIDEWLTKGRNSCPLCRGQGVDEKEKPPVSASSAPSEAPPASGATSSSASFVDATSIAT